MLEETHRVITRLIAELLKLNEHEAGLLLIGSTSPDSWANFPHHKDKEHEIIEHILNARRLFSEGDDECFHELGIALHYIQDKWTLRPRISEKHTRWERAMNDSVVFTDDSKLEEFIKNETMPTKAIKAYLGLLEKTKKGVKGSEIEEYDLKQFAPFLLYVVSAKLFPERTQHYLKVKVLRGIGAKVIDYAVQDRPTGWSSPTLDVNFAFRICLEVARYVLLPFRDDMDDDWFDKEAVKELGVIIKT